MHPLQRPAALASLFLSTAMLCACGGGGSSSATTSTDTTSGRGSVNSGVAASTVLLTGVSGFKVNYTPNFANPTAWTGNNTAPATYASGASINRFDVTDSASPGNTFSYDSANGLRSGTFVKTNFANQGGTTYTYARFGWMQSEVAQLDGSSTFWYAPYALASETPAQLQDTQYAGIQQASVYLQGDRSVGLPGPSGYAICDTSTSYTAASKTLQLRVSQCGRSVGYAISGDITLRNGGGTTTLTAPTNNAAFVPGSITSTTVDSGNYLLAGPQGEELVGAALVNGSLTFPNSPGTSVPARFFLVFGGKKQ